ARQSPGWAGMTSIAPTLRYDDSVMDGSGVPTDLIGSITVPVLAVAGGASPDFLQYGARGVADAARDGRFELLEGQGHDVRADAVAPVLHDFLRVRG
ncbi:MAG: alpha/beta fold hydrolase, partial [Gammaproteobacteria bacterium]